MCSYVQYDTSTPESWCLEMIFDEIQISVSQYLCVIYISCILMNLVAWQPIYCIYWRACELKIHFSPLQNTFHMFAEINIEETMHLKIVV